MHQHYGILQGDFIPLGLNEPEYGLVIALSNEIPHAFQEDKRIVRSVKEIGYHTAQAGEVRWVHGSVSRLALLRQPYNGIFRHIIPIIKSLWIVAAQAEALHAMHHQLAEDHKDFLRLFFLNDVSCSRYERDLIGTSAVALHE